MGKRLASMGLALVLAIGLLAAAGGYRFLHAALSLREVEGRSRSLQVPELKWQHGGCYSSWCETGWYSSPAVADLDGDGKAEVIAGAYTIFLLNGEDGSVQRSVDTAGNRVWPGVVVADLDGDNDLEIVTAQGGGHVNVLDHTGDVVWTRQPTSSELRGLSVYDLDDDGSMEIVVNGAVGSKTNTWVYEHNGTLRAGWPQLAPTDSSSAYGVFNDNGAIGDIDGDGLGELIIPSDVHSICAYKPDGSQIAAHSMYGDKVWGQVGLWESLAIELRGWGTCDSDDGREERYRPNFAHSPAAIADVNSDGVMEIVATGNMYDCIPGYPSKYNALYILNSDRSRFNEGGYDWQNIPVDTGAPLIEDYGVIESVHPNPALADLDGDGNLEIVYPSYDGKVHAFWLDKTEHGNWPYAVHTGGPYRFASEPVVADLDNDGYAEVIFGSWVQKGTGQTGKLHVLDYLGNVIHEVDLPAAFGSPDWNGALAAPTLANIDDDSDLEVVLNTAHSGLVVYDLPGSQHARVMWGTGRGNYQRTGWLPNGALDRLSKVAYPILPDPGDNLTYTIRLHSTGRTLPFVRVTDTVPSDVHYLDNLWASSGSYGQSDGVITWTGVVDSAAPVTITYGVTVSVDIITPLVIASSVSIADGLGNVWRRWTVVIAGGQAIYLPLAARGW